MTTSPPGPCHGPPAHPALASGRPFALSPQTSGSITADPEFGAPCTFTSSCVENGTSSISLVGAPWRRAPKKCGKQNWQNVAARSVLLAGNSSRSNDYSHHWRRESESSCPRRESVESHSARSDFYYVEPCICCLLFLAGPPNLYAPSTGTSPAHTSCAPTSRRRRPTPTTTAGIDHHDNACYEAAAATKAMLHVIVLLLLLLQLMLLIAAAVVAVLILALRRRYRPSCARGASRPSASSGCWALAWAAPRPRAIITPIITPIAAPAPT